MGRDFLGAYDLFADALLLSEGGVHHRSTAALLQCLNDPKLPAMPWLLIIASMPTPQLSVTCQNPRLPPNFPRV
jgi:hypothetical protein